jgi:hypothetical protein
MKFSLSSEFTRTFNYRKYLNIRLSGLYIVKKMRSVNNIQTLSSFNFSQKTKTKKNSTILTENNHFEDLIKWSQENNSSINYLKLKEISSDNRCLVADRKIKVSIFLFRKERSLLRFLKNLYFQVLSNSQNYLNT